MKRSFLILFSLLFSFVCPVCFGQENIAKRPEQLLSPEVKADNTVVFRLYAPEAKSVALLGNWMDANSPGGNKREMEKDANGVWTVEQPAMARDLFIYNFLLDGVRISDPLNVYQIRDVGNIFNYFITHGGQAELYKNHVVPHGSLSKRWYASSLNAAERRLSVYTPPGYEAGKQKYPVLYLLHGMGGDEEAWPTLGRVCQIMDNLIAAGRIVPMIVVMPNGHTANSAAPGYSERGEYPVTFASPDVGSGAMESTFMEVVAFTEKNYRVKKDKKHRAIAGLSMGGSHSLFIAAANAGTFDYVGLFSAAFRINDKIKQAVYDDFPANLQRQKEKGYRLYWIGMGKTDFLYQVGADYRKRLDEMGMSYSYYESEGGHTWSNWRDYLVKFSEQLFR